MDENRIQRIKQRYGIVGRSEALDRALEIALKIAPVDLSVLITGENGVGKEIFPRIIHDASARRSKKYFAVNCGAIPEGTIDSELFGHEKGAFTGAIGERDGYFGAASGGTLFLDEVGELPLPTQARLLRVLETGEYIRVGSSEVRKTDVRIVAATNVDMARAVAEGRFREDLFYRLNSIPIAIPPLRERGEDIVLLFRKFALEMSEKYKMPPLRLTDEAGRRLVAYSWPGNVRQLKNLTENMSEGFLLLDGQGHVLSHNSGALRLLNAEEPTGEVNALVLNRSEAFRRGVEELLEGRQSRQMLKINGRFCQMLANPVMEEGKTAGGVIVLLDVTESERREELRREFTANVSHELKTPLTSISGIAEIMKNGIVKGQDVPGFAADIYQEAQRLIALVEDIIRLSQLDEGAGGLEPEPVELLSLAGEVATRLGDAARQNQVALSVGGSAVEVSVVRMVLDDILYYLCENSI